MRRRHIGYAENSDGTLSHRERRPTPVARLGVTIMTPIVAVILQDEQALDRVGAILSAHGLRAILWHGSGGAHAFIARRRPNLVVLSTPLENREAATRLIEELCWDPETRGIPLIVDPERGCVRGCGESHQSEILDTDSHYVDELVQLIEIALAETRIASSAETGLAADV